MRTDWTGRTFAAVGAAILAGGLAPFAFRPPRYTLLNTSLRVDYPWWVAAAAAGATLALLAAAAAVRPRMARWAIGAVAAFAGLLTASRLAYRLEAGPDALVAREWTGATALPWNEVTRVDRGPERLVVWGKGDAQVRVDTSGFREDQRASLERTIARRVSSRTEAVTRR
jgi:hypothetical protein